MKITPNSKYVLMGDSITDAGRDPCGEATPWGAPGHGRGYVGLMEAWIGSTRPQDRIRLINKGVSGNTTTELKQRWKTDVLDLNPDWLSVMIGVNDIWRQFDIPLRIENHVYIDQYRQNLDELLSATRPLLKGLILATPHMIEPNRADPMRKMIDDYGQVVREMAAKYDAIFVDVQGAFDEILKHTHPMTLAWDRIHPNTTGHMVIARAFLKAIDAL